MRDGDFAEATKRKLAARVGHVCSCPECRAQTSGPRLEPDKSVSVGDAAHITAASPKGPRYDSSLTPEERRDYDNGIWLCVNHARIVDDDESRYTVEVLRRWKEDAEAEAQSKLGKPQVSPEPAPVNAGDVDVSSSVIAGAGVDGPGGDVRIEGGTGRKGASGGDVRIGPGEVKAGDGGPGGKGGDVVIRGGDAE